MTPFFFCVASSCNSALRAPRSLNEPVRWKLSSLQKTRAPVISESGIDSGQGETMTPPAMRRRAARISARVTDWVVLMAPF